MKTKLCKDVVQCFATYSYYEELEGTHGINPASCPKTISKDVHKRTFESSQNQCIVNLLFMCKRRVSLSRGVIGAKAYYMY